VRSAQWKEESVTPEQLVEQLKQACPSGLKSVMLYGSAAAGDHVGKRSDYNVLVVTDKLGFQELKAFAPAAAAWAKAGNPPPLLFTLDRLKRSSDAFPIELLDIRDSHRVLYGQNVASEIEVRSEDLRLQLEHELKGKLIQLREHFLLTKGKPKEVIELLISSLSSFLVLFRAALRLWQDEVPKIKIDAVRELSRHLEFDPKVFETVDAMKSGRLSSKQTDPDALFSEYLATIERIADAVDAHL